MLPAEAAGKTLILVLNRDSAQDVEIRRDRIMRTRNRLCLDGRDGRFGLRLNG